MSKFKHPIGVLVCASALAGVVGSCGPLDGAKTLPKPNPADLIPFEIAFWDNRRR